MLDVGWNLKRFRRNRICWIILKWSSIYYHLISSVSGGFAIPTETIVSFMSRPSKTLSSVLHLLHLSFREREREKAEIKRRKGRKREEKGDKESGGGEDGRGGSQEDGVSSGSDWGVVSESCCMAILRRNVGGGDGYKVKALIFQS